MVVKNGIKKLIDNEYVIEEIRTDLMDRFVDYFENKYSMNSLYHDIIDVMKQNYNNGYHRSIKCKLAEVNNRNEKIVWETMYGKAYNKVISFKFNVGDFVRFREFKDMRFDKGYIGNYSEEVFTVIAVISCTTCV